jgi:hypothetical protein
MERIESASSVCFPYLQTEGSIWPLDVVEVQRRAREQLREERMQRAVAEEVVRLRTKRSLWDRIIPFTVRIERKK